MTSLLKLNRLCPFWNKHFGLLGFNSCMVSSCNSRSVMLFTLPCDKQITPNNKPKVSCKFKTNHRDGHFPYITSDTKCCAQFCDWQVRNSSSDSKSSPITSEKRTIGSLSATLVDNSSNSIKPYLQLMRLDRPIGNYNN